MENSPSAQALEPDSTRISEHDQVSNSDSQSDTPPAKRKYPNNSTSGQNINSLAQLASILHPTTLGNSPSSNTSSTDGESRRASSSESAEEDLEDPSDATPGKAPSKKRKNSQITVEELEDVERTVDDKDRRRKLRLLKNRQSAALSRQRKKEYIGNLEKRVDDLNNEKLEVQTRLTSAVAENKEARHTIADLSTQVNSLQEENRRLRGQVKAVAASAAFNAAVALSAASNSNGHGHSHQLLHTITPSNSPAPQLTSGDGASSSPVPSSSTFSASRVVSISSPSPSRSSSPASAASSSACTSPSSATQDATATTTTSSSAPVVSLPASPAN